MFLAHWAGLVLGITLCTWVQSHNVPAAIFGGLFYVALVATALKADSTPKNPPLPFSPPPSI